MKIGIMTGGGDAPGLNGIIESVSRVLLNNQTEIIGIKNGFEGIYKNDFIPLNYENIKHAHSFAGTILGSSNKSAINGREEEFVKQYKKLNLDGLVVCGGDGTFAALNLVKDNVNIIGVPKTIDNDLNGTDITFGFDTACSVVSESIDSLRYTAEAHDRIIVVETMGRTAGWIALCGGLSSYSDVILIPERNFEIKKLVDHIKQKRATGAKSLMIVVSEGAHEKDGDQHIAFEEKNAPEQKRLGGIAFYLSRLIEKETGWESRHVVLGHLQRSKSPSNFDRLLTLEMGVKAAQLVKEKNWNQAVVYEDGHVCSVPITKLMQGPRLVPNQHQLIQKAMELGIYI